MREILLKHLQRSYADTNLPKTVLKEARLLASQGKYDAALEKHLWLHRHALVYSEAFAGVRLSFALREWVDLGEIYPPARETLLAVRDDAAHAIEIGNGSHQLFMDVAAINKYLQDSDRTILLFKSMHSCDRELAKRCYAVAEELLVERCEYAICISYLPILEQRLEAIRQSYEMTLEIAADFALRFPQSRLNRHANEKLDKETNRLIAILEGVGQFEDANRVREFVREQGRK